MWKINLRPLAHLLARSWCHQCYASVIWRKGDSLSPYRWSCADIVSTNSYSYKRLLAAVPPHLYKRYGSPAGRVPNPFRIKEKQERSPLCRYRTYVPRSTYVHVHVNSYTLTLSANNTTKNQSNDLRHGQNAGPSLGGHYHLHPTPHHQSTTNTAHH